MIKWGHVLTNKHTMSAIFVCFFGTWAIIDYVGFIAEELITSYKMADDVVGYLFAAKTGLYLVMSLLYPYTFEHMSRKLQFIIAMIGLGFCHLMMGPSGYLGLPNEVWIVIVGMIL